MIGGFFFFLVIVTVVSATNHNNNHNNFNNHNYCLNREISFDPKLDTVQVERETESSSINFYHNTEAACDNNNNNYDNNNNNVSNHNHIAIFIHGGAEMTPHDRPTPSRTGSDFAPFVSMAEGSFISYLQDRMNWDDEDLFDDDDEDEDDDDNDGHSSMLSNASIRRRVSSAATTRSYYYHNGNNNGRSMMNSSEKNGNSLQKSIPLLSDNRFRRYFGQRDGSNTSSSALNQVLKVRGGASPSGVALADDFAKRLVAAALVTVLFEGMIGHILEFFKISMQTAPVGTSYYSILKSITQEKGIAGVWDGFIPWGVVQSVAKGGVFGLAHAVSKEYLNVLVQKGVLSEQIALTMAGGVAGGFQGFVLSPLLLLKTRVMTNPVFREKMSALKTTYLSLAIGLEVVKNEGLLALMKGADVFSLKRVFDWSTRYYFSDFFKAAMVQNGFGVDGALTRSDKIIASLMGGTASTLCTLPLDVIVAKSQDAKKAGVKVSAWETFMKDYKEGGMKGLYDANMMHSQ